MILILALACFTRLTSSAIENANTRVMKYQAFNLPVPLNMSEDDMKVNLSTFVRHHGNQLRAVREDPNDDHIKGKILELMKQAIYAAQDRVKHLEKVLDKYAGDATFRMGFIFTKLDQLLEDLKRIYSMAVKDTELRNRYHVMYYEHAAKKNIDITYIVEHLIAIHTRVYTAVQNYDITQNKQLDLNLNS